MKISWMNSRSTTILLIFNIKIYPDIDLIYNSLNIFLGQWGSGKTFNGFNTVALISRADTKFHLFVFVSNDPNDEITIPSVLISYADSAKYLTELIEFKH